MKNVFQSFTFSSVLLSNLNQADDMEIKIILMLRLKIGCTLYDVKFLYVDGIHPKLKYCAISISQLVKWRNC